MVTIILVVLAGLLFGLFAVILSSLWAVKASEKDAELIVKFREALEDRNNEGE